MKKLLLTFAIICAMLVPAAIAQAARIDNWTYGAKIAYDNMNFQGASYPPGYSTKDSMQIGGKTVYGSYRWGETNPSNAMSTARYSGQIAAGITREMVGYSYLTNNPVPITSAQLKSGDILIALNLSSGSVKTEVSTSLHFGYSETLNLADGTRGDMFFFTDKWLADASTRNFIVDGHEYQLKLEVEGRFLKELSGNTLNWAKSLISSSDYNQKIYGMVIPEAISYQLDYYVKINYVGPQTPTVPVPGAVWLLGTGIAGLAAVNKRRKKN